MKNTDNTPPPRFSLSIPIYGRSLLMLRPRTFVLFAGIALLAIALTVSATDRALLPGDPVGPDDLIFVDLDSSDKATCGVTKANNIRCWGNNRFAPVRAEGFTDVAVRNPL